MEKDILKAIMHPIRIKIIQELGFIKSATTKVLQESCGDCAQATFYRHIKALHKHKIIKVESTHKINGITEKVYALADDLSSRIIKNPNEMKKEDYLNLFTQYILSILSNFSSYFKEEDAIENAPRNIGFSSNTLLLTDDEFNEMTSELSEVVSKRINNTPSKSRKMRMLSTIITTSTENKYRN